MQKVNEFKDLDENEVKRNYATCGICSEEKFVQNVIIPCGHNGYCVECLNKCMTNNPNCPYCRTPM